ncbi:hypothetical protein J4573_03255 [Actinomadura barringtoniae]|uniref:Uncharacterized protein n=1 Tax=Actinomadura barringtoniae TaxID=1427535 RepID=A0A939T4M3_9ACTN|nr:hypothetical protein [Actinomadura barringtoniae]MBO2446092.1 hypothetical protein [Actinomadura barringtoniae]
MAFMTFTRDRDGLPLFHAAKPYTALGSWLITDVSIHKAVALDALAMLADVSVGRDPFTPWSSENYSVAFSSAGLSISAHYADEQSEYRIAEAREALDAFWRFLASQPERTHMVREYYPDLPETEAEIRYWEDHWGRPHPDRGRLF